MIMMGHETETVGLPKAKRFILGSEGMTLVELMTGMVIALGVAGAGFMIFTSTHKATVANEQVVDTQQNVRLAMDLLSRDIKQAGFGMVNAVGACTVAGTAAAIVPVDQTPTGADTGPDSIRLVVPIRTSVAPAWSLASPAGGTSGFSQITLTSGAVANMVTEAGGSLIGANISIAGVATTTVSNVAGDTLTVATVPPPIAVPAGMPVYLLQCVTYSIGTTTAACSGDAPCLLRNGVSIADGIEDIQFAYACDGCLSAVNGGVADRIIDNQGGAAGFDQADFITNNAWATAPMTPDTIRLVQLTIVARQTDTDRGMGEANAATVLSPSALVVSDHDHSQGLFAAGDFSSLNPAYSSYRRRVLTRTIDTRNIQ
jgi:type IV pilus assembly protein PilW